MSELVYDVLGLVYWAAIVGGVLWWMWSIRRSSRPRSRTRREEAELAGLQVAIIRGRAQTAGRPGD